MAIVALLIGLIACVVPIAVVVLIITAIVKRNKEDRNTFDETIRNIYVYIVLIITLITIISGVIYTFRIGVDILLPEKSLYENSYSNEQRDRNEDIIEFTTTLTLVVSVIPVFMYHNKLSKKAKDKKMQENESEETNN